MASRSTAARRCVAYLLLGASIVGCGGAAPSPAVTVAPSRAAVVPSPSPTPAATTTPTPDPTPEPTAPPSRRPPATPSPTFESPFYRYTITLPVGIQTLNWKAAQRPWNGTAMLDRAGPYTDQTGIAEGGIFLFGGEAESLQAWFEVVEGNGVRYHRCTPARNRVDVVINDVPAIGFAQSCEQGTNMARVALWKDGWGIAMWHGEAPVGELPAMRDRAIEFLHSLEWHTD
jgi:hypothetical protein